MAMWGIWKDIERDNSSLLWNSLFTAWNLVMPDSRFSWYALPECRHEDRIVGWPRMDPKDQLISKGKVLQALQALPERKDWGIWPFRLKAGTNQFITTDWLNRLLVSDQQKDKGMGSKIPSTFTGKNAPERNQWKQIKKKRPDSKMTNGKAMSGNCTSSFKGKEEMEYRGPLITKIVSHPPTVRLLPEKR